MINSKDYIMTHSKINVDPFDIQPEDVNIKDIAHSLSMMARANGHFKYFFSVAQHSINCFIEAKNRGKSKRIQLACLLHDAAEAYIADIPRPVKNRLLGYVQIEQDIIDVIFSVFGLSDISVEEYHIIDEIDNALLYYEFDELMGIKLTKDKPYISKRHDFANKDIEVVCSDFITCFNSLHEQEKEAKYDVNNKIVGVDGCRGGWMAFIIDKSGHTVKVYNSIESLCKENYDAQLIIVDMPIGLPESIDEVRPDSEARQLLKGKASSIFSCPCRQAIYENSYELANTTNKKVLDKGLSKQSFAIAPKIKEIDEFLRTNESFRNKLVEGHPEVCFAKLYGKPVLEKKSTQEGVQKRLRILSEYHEGLDETIVQNTYKKSVAQTDDIIDAMCMAVVAKLGQHENLYTIPINPQRDRKGLAMQMVYARGRCNHD